VWLNVSEHHQKESGGARYSTTIRIAVKDEGPGLNEQDQEKLFQKFSRLSPQPTAGEHSTGLGLSIAKGLAELMHGTVSCVSAPQAGATFVLELPARVENVGSESPSH
jgi:signal transduction histidine kinase